MIPGPAGAAANIDDTRTLRAILTSAPHQPDDANYVFLVEHEGEGGAWFPSARMLRGSSPLPASITATPDRWRLSNGHRITMLDQNFTVSLQRVRGRREARHAATAE